MPTVFVNGKQRQYEKGTTFETIVDEFQEAYKGTIALVYFNKKMRELGRRLEKDGVISLITTKDPAGHSAYARTALMMLCKAAREVFGSESNGHIKVEFTLGDAYYCSVLGDVTVDDELVEKLNEGMTRLMERNIQVVKKTYPIDDAILLFRHQGMEDKENTGF